MEQEGSTANAHRKAAKLTTLPCKIEIIPFVNTKTSETNLAFPNELAAKQTKRELDGEKVLRVNNKTAVTKNPL